MKVKQLYSSTEIQSAVSVIAEKIDSMHSDNLVLICVLNGGYMFFSDLTRALKTPHEVDFVSISSYGHNTESSGDVNIIKDITIDMDGKDVVIVEDIVDTGNTLNAFIKHLEEKRANDLPDSLSVCALIDAPFRRTNLLEFPLISGIKMDEEHFIFGYGLDFQGKYRNLDCIVYKCED